MSIHDKYAEQRIAAAEHDLVEAHKRIHKLEELVRDMWPSMWESCLPAEEFKALEERMRDLGLEVDE